MKIYPSQIRRSVRLLKRMRSNSRKMMMWKNYPLANEVVSMLDALPERSVRHSPYDKIFLMKILLDNISKSDTPRFAISVLERQAALFKSVTEEDLKEYDDPMTVGEVEAELGKWREYIDFDGVTEEEWCSKYHRYLRFDPIERTPLWEEIYYEVEKETDEAIGRNVPRGMGFCFMYWSSKADVLARRGISWKSPHEMNPRVMFD